MRFLGRLLLAATLGGVPASCVFWPLPALMAAVGEAGGIGVGLVYLFLIIVVVPLIAGAVLRHVTGRRLLVVESLLAAPIVYVIAGQAVAHGWPPAREGLKIVGVTVASWCLAVAGALLWDVVLRAGAPKPPGFPVALTAAGE